VKPLRVSAPTKVVVFVASRRPSGPVAVRHAHAQAFALRAASSLARHVGGRPSLVDEDEPFRVEVGLAVEPVLAPLQDIGPVLLAGVRRLFERDPVLAEEAPEPGDAGRNVFLRQRRPDLDEREVPVGRHDRQDGFSLALRPSSDDRRPAPEGGARPVRVRASG
jgi:hypothetical protein